MSDTKQDASDFDENKSRYVMPRLYEHIDRVDLWVMAQKDQYDRDKSELEAVKAQRDELKELVQWAYPHMDDLRIRCVSPMLSIKLRPKK